MGVTGNAETEALFVETVGDVEELVAAENRSTAARARSMYEFFLAAVEHSVEYATDGPGGSGAVVREYALLDPWAVARDELAARLTQPCGRIGAMLDFAIDLHERCPAVLRGMDDGLLAERTATDIVSRLRGVDDTEVCREIAEELMARLSAEFEAGRRLGRAAVRNLADDVVREFDPEGVRRRREEAHRDRGVWFRPVGDGITDMQALLPAAQAEILAERLDKLAGVGAGSVVLGPEESRTADQRRADALVALALAAATEAPADATAETATTSTGPTADPTVDPTTTSTGPTAAPALRPQITVVVPTGSGETEVHVRRSGASSLEALESLLAMSSGATVRRTGLGATPVSDEEKLGYRLPEELARRVRQRDGTCRHPGCSVPAARCDIDHVIPFDHADPAAGGHSVESNLVCLCRSHHRLKTFGSWEYEVDGDGVLTIRTAIGRRVVTTPVGPLARARAQATHEKQRRDRVAAEQTELNRERDAAEQEEADDPPPF